MRSAAIVLACLIGGLAESPGAWAQSSARSPKRLVVAIPEEGTGLPSDELITALRGQLAELGVEVVLSRRPLAVASESSHEAGQQDALAFVWLGKEGDVLAVHFLESAGAALRQRRLPLRGTDAASLEEVALVVRSAVSALLERKAEEEVPTDALHVEDPKPNGAERLEPRAADAETDEALRSARPFWLGLGWVGQSYAPELLFSHGFETAFHVRPASSRWGLGLSYQLLPAQTKDFDQIRATLFRHPLEAFFIWQEPLMSETVFAGAQAGALFDLVRRTTQVSGTEFEPLSDALRVSFAVSLRGTLAVRLLPHIALEGQAGADVVMERVVVQIEDGAELVAPRRIRPRFSALLLWGFP